MPASPVLANAATNAALARARAQTYDRVVQILDIAEEMAVQVGDWQGFPVQDAYRKEVAQQHQAKTTFWIGMNAAELNWRR